MQKIESFDGVLDFINYLDSLMADDPSEFAALSEYIVDIISDPPTLRRVIMFLWAERVNRERIEKAVIEHNHDIIHVDQIIASEEASQAFMEEWKDGDRVTRPDGVCGTIVPYLIVTSTAPDPTSDSMILEKIDISEKLNEEVAVDWDNGEKTFIHKDLITPEMLLSSK